MDFNDAQQRWDSRYRRVDGYFFGTTPNAWLAEQSHRLSPHSSIVSVADGEGRNATFLAQQGHRLSAFDISGVAIERLKALAKQRSVSVQCRQCTHTQWAWQANSLDAVIAIYVQFMGPESRTTFIRQVVDALRPGGLCIIEGYGPRQLDYKTGGPRVLENLYRLPELIQAFEGCEVLAARDRDCQTTEGAGHSGRSHIVSAVFRRLSSDR